MPQSVPLQFKEAVERFGRTMMTRVSSPDCHDRINIVRAFEEFLYDSGTPKSTAAELAERWQVNVVERIEQCLCKWEDLGIPRPMAPSGNPLTFITWTHPKYTEITGRPRLPADFARISSWIAAQDGRAFLFTCCCYLRLLGADLINITDGRGDGGIDIICRLPDGPFRSMCLLVQAKACTHEISRDTLLLEYGKYAVSIADGKLRQYIGQLHSKRNGDGATYAFVIICGNEFVSSAQAVARDLGVLLRSRSQLAYWLGSHTNFAKLKSLEAASAQFLMAGSANIAEHLKF